MRSVGWTAVGSVLVLAAATFGQGADTVAPGAAIDFRLPQAGHATIVVNDAQGVRVRNLLADTPFAAGAQQVRWDGLDDAGKPVAVGSYHWAGLYRGDMHAVYRGSFTPGNPPWLYGTTGGWVADHSYPTTIASVGEQILIGSTEAEWGHGLIAADLEGKKLWGIRWLAMKNWAGADTIVTLGDAVFATSYPGMSTVWQVDPTSGESHIVLELADIPKAEQNAAPRLPIVENVPCQPVGLRVVGARKTGDGGGGGGHDGELFVADLFGKEPKTYVFSTKVEHKKDRLPLLRTLPVRPWSLGFLSDGRCVAVMDQSVDILDVQTGQSKPLIAGLAAPYALAVDAKDRIFISDQGGDDEIRFNPYASLVQRAMRSSPKASNQVKIYDASGQFLRAIGREGGRAVGKYNPLDLLRPGGLAVDSRGRLWLTEMTFQPKRVSVWNIPGDLAQNAPTLAREIVGPTTYGGGAAMIDPEKPWEIMDTNYGVLFDVTLPAADPKPSDPNPWGAYTPLNIPWRQYLGRKEHSYRPLLPFDGKPVTLFKIDGRRYSFLQGGYEHGPDAHWQAFVGAGDACTLGELRGAPGEETFVPLAAIGNIRMLLRSRELLARREEQWIPTPLLEAAKRRPDWETLAKEAGMDPAATDAPHVPHARGSSVYIASPWPQAISGFIWTDVNNDGKMQADEIELFDSKEADQVAFDRQLNAYLTFVQRTREPPFTLRLPREGFAKNGAPLYHFASAQKIPGNIYVSEVGADGSLLSMNSLHDSAGKEIWSYPVGGPAKTTPKEELLKPGRMGRLHALRGIASAPNDLGEVFMVHSTDGMSYFLTRDGLFIATLFEPWNCAPGWDSIPEAKLGMNLEDYTLQDECFNGAFTQAQATGKGFEKGHYYITGLARSAVLELTGLETAHRLPGGEVRLLVAAPAPVASRTRPAPADLPLLAGAKYGRPVQYADAATSVSWDKDALHLKWQVSKDDTPMINNEKDWTLLFTAGDGCDLQISSPKLGRCRYLFTVFEGEPVAIRFQFDAKAGDKAVTYKSGVLETRVGVVEKLDVKPTITRGKNSYELEVALPWSVLEITPRTGEKIPCELGVIRSNAAGTRAVSRDYWHSGESGMVSDVPTEARPTDKWGTLQLR